MLAAYSEESIQTLSPREHIRLRPGMYIGKLGDGSAADDGIYVLLKEIIDNSIDEFLMGAGKVIDIRVSDHEAEVRDYGRGIPLGKLIECVSQINTGGKYSGDSFQKSVGLNGVGTKAVNALSTHFVVESYRENQTKRGVFTQGELVEDGLLQITNQKSGTRVVFRPDDSVFKHYCFRQEFIEAMVWNYAFLNRGLTLVLNGQKIRSERGLRDLLEMQSVPDRWSYAPIHLLGTDVELCLTHQPAGADEYFTFVNGQYTPMGGTHLTALREILVKGVRDFYKKEFDAADIRSGLVAALSVRLQEPVFESQTKTKLGSTHVTPGGATLRSWLAEQLLQPLDNWLHQHKDTAEALLQRILEAERERKELAGLKKLASERTKKANLHNRKLRDCKVHLTDRHPHAAETTLFITEGDSASGSITKSRDPEVQAVFSLKGKPLNVFGLSKKVVYENEEFSLLLHALNVEDGLQGLRYQRIVLATDADVDGMHIRLLLMTFFLQFFPELVRHGHLFILQTPLFRVRNKQITNYCYSEAERDQAVTALGGKPEITRFKGLGEISPEEFEGFIGSDIRLDPVIIRKDTSIATLLEDYMGKNTPERQRKILDNLRTDLDRLPSVNELAPAKEVAPVIT